MSYNRSKEDDKRLKKLYSETKNSYRGGAYIDKKRHVIKRYSVGSSWAKAQSSKAVRRKLKNSDIVYSKGQYRRLYDYWWTVT